MANSYFQFKQFRVNQAHAAMKVGTDSVLLGAWAGNTLPCGIASILDIGTGTGILALMMAQRFPLAEIDAVEIDSSAYLQAAENVHSTKWSERIKLYHSSFQSYSQQCSKKYDLIISNPPYFNQSLLPPNEQRSTARHSSCLTHDELALHALSLLQPNGKLAVVFPISEGEAFISSLTKMAACSIRELRIHPNPSKPTNRILLEFSINQAYSIHTDNLYIEMASRHEYSPEYRDLTKDFYLKF